jgi:transposase
MPSYESSMRNLAKARATMRQPRPWRGPDESRMIRRYVFQWHTACGKKPSGRDWAQQLCISHTWLQKLVRQFQADPSKMYQEARRCGDPTYAQLLRAREYTQQMRERGEVRPTGRTKQIEALLKSGGTCGT